MKESNLFLTEQAKKLKEFIDNFIKCCESRKFYETRKFSLPYVESKCLLFLKDQRYLTVNQLANLLDVTKSRASNLIKDLLKKEFIEVILDPKDKRIKLISLTPKGRKKVKEIENFQIQIHKRLLEGFDFSERITLLNFIERLKMNMEAIKKEMIRHDIENKGG